MALNIDVFRRNPHKGGYQPTCAIKNPMNPPQGKNSIIKDSGERREFDTGAVRDMSSGKGRFDLIPPEMVMAYARHTENGCIKYGERNWEKGIPLSSFFDSALRHLFKYMMGMKDEDHLVAALWNIGNLVTTRDRINAGILPESLDNLPNGR